MEEMATAVFVKGTRDLLEMWLNFVLINVSIHCKTDSQCCSASECTVCWSL